MCVNAGLSNMAMATVCEKLVWISYFLDTDNLNAIAGNKAGLSYLLKSLNVFISVVIDKTYSIKVPKRRSKLLWKQNLWCPVFFFCQNFGSVTPKTI